METEQPKIEPIQIEPTKTEQPKTEQSSRGPLTVGYYHPTASFLSVTEHIAVMDANEGLVALTGYSLAQQDAQVVARSIADACLFAAAPELLETARALATLVRFLDPRARRTVTAEGEDIIDELLRRADENVAKAAGPLCPADHDNEDHEGAAAPCTPGYRLCPVCLEIAHVNGIDVNLYRA